MISVVASVYQSEEYLEGFFQNLLEQTFKDFEIVLVLNDPTEKELSIVTQYSSLLVVVFISIPLEPTSTSINRGISISKGDILVVTGADDRFVSDAFSKFVQAFLYNPTIDVVYCDHIAIDTTGKFLWKRTPQDPNFSILKKRYYMSPCNIFKRYIFDVEGGFKEEYNLASDYEFMLRLASKGYNFLRIPEVLFLFVRMPGALTNMHSRAHRDVITRVRNLYDVIV